MVPSVIAVGCAPSSGSTLLADLIDSVPGMACGPELNIFCIPDAYSFESSFKRRAIRNEPFPIPVATSQRSRFFNRRHLSETGVSEKQLTSMIEGSHSLPEFWGVYVGHYRKFRNKQVTVLAEKTPDNVYCIEKFLECFPQDLFVHVVRDGRAVVGSLRRRGFGLLEGAIVWMLYVQSRLDVGNSPKIIDLRYEDLVADPFSTVATLARRAGLLVAERDIRAFYASNSYRRDTARVVQWRVNTFNGKIDPNLGYRDDLSDDEVAVLENVIITEAGRHIAFAETMNLFGYALEGRRPDRSIFERELIKYQKSKLRHLHAAWQPELS